MDQNKRRAEAFIEWFLAGLLIALVVMSIATKATAAPRKCFGRVVTTNGTAQSDLIVGKAGNDVIGLGRGKDQAIALSGSDRVCGGRGDDELYGGDGFDYVRGGRGFDICVDFEVVRGCEQTSP